MKVDRSLKFMGFTMNAFVNTARSMFGGIAQMFLTFYRWPQLSMIKFFVFMVVFPQALTFLMRLKLSIENKKSLMMELCAI